MQYRRSPMKNARYCSAGLLDRDRPSPTQRLSAWTISITLVPSPLRLRSGACGCHGRAQAVVMPKTTYCSNPALAEIPKIGGLISVTHYLMTVRARLAPCNTARHAEDRLLKSGRSCKSVVTQLAREGSAARLAPTPGEVVTEFQSDSARPDSPVRVRYAQPRSRLKPGGHGSRRSCLPRARPRSRRDPLEGPQGSSIGSSAPRRAP